MMIKPTTGGNTCSASAGPVDTTPGHRGLGGCQYAGHSVGRPSGHSRPRWTPFRSPVQMGDIVGCEIEVARKLGSRKFVGLEGLGICSSYIGARSQEARGSLPLTPRLSAIDATVEALWPQATLTRV